MRKLTQEEFISKAKSIHGDKYDYSKTVYIRSAIKVLIHCNQCGHDFEQSANAHLMGHGCNYCAQVERNKGNILNTEEFIRRAKLIYGNRFDYSKVEYVNVNKPVEIICPEHGSFFTIPGNHLNGRPGCLKCKCDKARNKRLKVGIYDGFSKSGGKCKQMWENMLQRCYQESEQKRHPTYRGCSVCEEWMVFSNFEKWFNANYIDGYEIEKDIIVKGNKIYAPEFCCFVPRRINILITRRQRFRGDTPIGVKRRKSGRYHAGLDIDGVRKNLGTYDTVKEAFLAYKTAKEAYIKEVAQEYFDKGLITERVRNSLFRYKVEITD